MCYGFLEERRRKEEKDWNKKKKNKNSHLKDQKHSKWLKQTLRYLWGKICNEISLRVFRVPYHDLNETLWKTIVLVSEIYKIQNKSSKLYDFAMKEFAMNLWKWNT